MSLEEEPIGEALLGMPTTIKTNDEHQLTRLEKLEFGKYKNIGLVCV